MLQFPPLTPAVRALLIVLALTFVAQTILEGAFGLPLTNLLAVQPVLDVGLAWQWATYPWIEAPSPSAPLSRGLDLLFIYLMLAPHELRFGARQAVLLAALGVVAAAALVLAVGFVFPSHVGGAIGAGPIAYAAFGAFAQFHGKEPVRFFLLPPASAWVVLGVFLFLPLLSSFWSHDAAPFLMAIASAGAGILWARRRMAPTKVPTRVPPKRQAPPGRFRVIEGGGEGSNDDKPKWLN